MALLSLYHPVATNGTSVCGDGLLIIIEFISPWVLSGVLFKCPDSPIALLLM